MIESKNLERRTVRAIPAEVLVVLFALLLNLAWEFIQVPFFAGMPSMPHWDGVRLCTKAAAGDALLTLVAFWVTAAATGGRGWIKYPTIRTRMLFVGTAFAAAMLVEFVSVRVFGRWTYASNMPLVPGVHLGLVPVAQWIVLPPLVLWLVARQAR